MQTLAEADRILALADMEAEPIWVSFFTAEQWAAEGAYALHDCGDIPEITTLTELALNAGNSMERRRFLVTANLASAHLRGKRRKGADTEMACHLTLSLLPSLSGITSARVLAQVNSIRRNLAISAPRNLATEVEDAFHSALGV